MKYSPSEDISLLAYYFRSVCEGANSCSDAKSKHGTKIWINELIAEDTKFIWGFNELITWDLLLAFNSHLIYISSGLICQLFFWLFILVGSETKLELKFIYSLMQQSLISQLVLPIIYPAHLVYWKLFFCVYLFRVQQR